MIKVFLSDLDGTLIQHDLRISPSDKEAIHKLHLNGITFGIVTGRDLGFFHKYVDNEFSLKMDCIANNGATLYYNHKKVYEMYIDAKHVEQILQFVQPYLEEVHPFVASDECVFYFMEQKPNHSFWKKAEDHMGAVGPIADMGLMDYVKSTDNPIVKVSFFCRKQDPSSFAKLLRAKFGSQFEVSITCDYFVEVTQLGINKATAVEHLLRLYNVSLDEVAVIGDGENDIPMLKMGAHAFVMDSATDTIKRYGTVVRSVAEAVERVLKSRR